MVHEDAQGTQAKPRLPLRHEANFDWSNVVRLRLELRLTYRGNHQWDPNPDDLYVDDIRLP